MMDEIPAVESYGDEAGSETSYPEFTPPPGTIPEGQTEGEEMVKWKKKPDGTFCIVEFSGEPLSEPEESSAPPSADDQLDEMATS